jgi:hypothetical protein
MENKSRQQKWIEKNPLIWKLFCKTIEYIGFIIEVALALQILKLFGVV